MSRVNYIDPDFADFYTGLDSDTDWLSHEPEFEWTVEEIEMDQKYYEMEQLAMAAWWEMEGVRCATFGRNPNKNPYVLVSTLHEAVAKAYMAGRAEGARGATQDKVSGET